MKMHVLSGGRLRMKASIYWPEAPRDETREFPCACYLIRHPQGNVLFDSGCHPSVETDAGARWGGIAKAMTPVHAPGDNMLAGLKSVGVSVDDIDLVVNSHFHMDHCGCNEFFKRATFIVHARELEVARDPASEGNGYFRADWDQPMNRETIEAERDLFGDDRVVLIPLPGHTPGSIGAHVGLDRSGAFLLAADAVSIRDCLDLDYAPRNTWSAEPFLKSLAEIRRLEAAGATVLCGHDPAQWQTLRKGANAYE
ncbi:MAG TPA: N-acyl homoserine lactonase family protein [Xanthobacteraceae bacterium]|nr:N-acyl homoserine lactonase family protein [Xanthobacteraceae bacterium]